MNGYSAQSEPSHVTITEAPVKNRMIDDGGDPEQGWLTFFGDVADALNGEWGPQHLEGIVSAAAYSSVEIRGRDMGTTSYVSMDFSSFNSTAGDTIMIPKEYGVSAEFTILDVYALNGSDWLIQPGCSIEGNILTLPTVSGTRVLIKGLFIREV